MSNRLIACPVCFAKCAGGPQQTHFRANDGSATTKQDKEEHKDQRAKHTSRYANQMKMKTQNYDNHNKQNQTITNHLNNNKELIISTRSLFFQLFYFNKYVLDV
jgi:hypothetical protein